ncbi:MAG: SMC-Scp complex subunit ScpB [Bdellovibrionota bacterium]
MIDPKDQEDNITKDGFDFIEDEILEDTFDEDQNSELNDDDEGISFPSQEMLTLETEDVSRDDGDSASFPMQEMLALEAQVEAVIFASPKPIKVGELLEIIGGEDTGAKDIQLAVDRLMRFYEERGGGFKLENIRGGGYQFRTAKAAAPLMEKIFASRPRPISRAAKKH